MTRRAWIFWLVGIILITSGCSKKTDQAMSHDEAEPRWEDANRIIFAQNKQGVSEIVEMRVDGTSTMKVEGIPKGAFGPVVSPDGKKTAFYCHVSDTQWSLFLMEFESRMVTQVTEDNNCYD